MLASEMATVSQVSKSGLLLQATVAPTAAIARSTRLPRKYRHQQQIRSFRIGLWSSYLDPAFQKELQRRHRIIKHKYAEAVNRKLSWDRRLPVYASRWGLKGFMCSSWRAYDPRPGGRWVNVDEVREVKDEPKTTGDRGIEEVEQDAVDELFGRRAAPGSTYSDRPIGWNWATSDPTSEYLSRKGCKNARQIKTDKEQVSRHSRHHFAKTETPPSLEQEYIIDPITNRKVFQKGKQESETVPQDLETTAAEIPVKTFKGYRSQFSRFEPPIENAESVVIHLDGNLSSASQNSQSTSQSVKDEADQYKPFTYNEPDGQPPDQGDVAADNLRQYDHLYTAFKYNEPDGKFPEGPDSLSECLGHFDHQYKPVKYNEPDGKFPAQPETARKWVKDNSPRIGRGSQDHTSTSTEASWLSQEGFSSNAGRGREERVATRPVEQSQRSIIEPLLDRPPQSKASDIDQVTRDKEEDLDSLRASDIRAAFGISKAPVTKKLAEKDPRRTAPDTDFGKIQDRASSLAKEIAMTQRGTASRKAVQDLELELSYLLNHNAHARGRVDAKVTELDAEMAAEESHSNAQKTITGNFVHDFPEEFSASWTKGLFLNSCLVPKHDTEALGHNRSPKGLELARQQEMENEVQSAENDYATEHASGDQSNPTRMETALYRNLKADENKMQAEQDPYTKEPKGLETSYAEEVQEQGGSESPLFVKSYGCDKKAQKDKELVRGIRNIYEAAYGAIDCDHRQIVDSREEPEVSEDRESRMQRNIENLEQLVRESHYKVHERYMDVAKVLAKHVPSEQQVAATTGESSPPPEEVPAAAPSLEPTVYKILAYDPIMQNIKMAETTSVVSDTSSALTPAEVLLRLSNPAKFFPHFQPLQSQGYEIASGSGDVLVFRKVREGSPIIASAVPHSRKAINPIDGMQSVPQPVTGNFASPTGFVNHDLPSAPPFISGIDVRREEPVFSGRSEWRDADGNAEESGRKPRKVGRGLLIGAAWVAACSYAVGVVAEFFRTGGMDGKGPVGF